jgi:excisionase family DNA binding protein
MPALIWDAANAESLAELMTVKQLAKYLHVSTIWIYNHYRSELPHLRLGKRMIRFRKSEIDTIIKRRASVDRTSK